MATISPKISRSLKEYLILPGKVEVPPEEVSLETGLGHIELQYPFITSRMQCIVGPDMAVSAGRNGILTMVPRSLPDQDKQAILDANKEARLREGDIEFQEEPVYAGPEDTLDGVTGLVEKFGHSVIPIMDRKSYLYGVYIHDPEHPPSAPPDTPIREVMFPLENQSKKGVPYLTNSEDEKEIKKALRGEEKKFLPIIDENGILQKLAFLQKFDTNYIGMAITSREGYQEEIERWGPQVDTLCIDSSNACFDDAIDILKYAKKKFPDIPFGIGNIVREEHFSEFADEGADYIIGGMGVGSICLTGAKRGNGRGQMTVARELAKARDKYAEQERYVPLVLDGSIRTIKDMSIALAFADYIMMCNYFNRFYEVAARKLDENKEPTHDEALMRYVETWGEGHPIARLVAMYGMGFRDESYNQQEGEVTERYGHSSLAGATIEGVLKTVPYRGRLKPGVEEDARYLRTNISNAGGRDLESYRENVVLERASPTTLKDMLPHSVENIET